MITVMVIMMMMMTIMMSVRVEFAISRDQRVRPLQTDNFSNAFRPTT